MIVGHGMRILDVEVVTPRVYVFSRHLPSPRCFLTARAVLAAPPLDTALQMLEADRFSHRVGFLSVRYPMLVEPDLFGRGPLLEKQQIGADRSVRFEN